MAASICWAGGGFPSPSPPQSHLPVDAYASLHSVKQRRRNSRPTTFARWKAYGICTLKTAPLLDLPYPRLNWALWPSSSQNQNSQPQRSPAHSAPASPFFSCTFLPHRQFLQIHASKPPSEKLALLSGTPLLVVRKDFFAGNSMFDGNVTQKVMGGLGCGAVTKECRTGRRIHMGTMLTPLRTLIDRTVIRLWMTRLGR